MTLVLIALIFFGLGIFACSVVNTNYKKRWQSATSLLEAKTTDDGELIEGDWKLESYIRDCAYTEGMYEGRKFQGLAFKAVREDETVEIGPHINSVAVNFSHPSFTELMKDYKSHASKVVNELNAN